MNQRLDYFSPPTTNEPPTKWWEYVRDIVVIFLILDLFLLACGLVLRLAKGL